MKRLYCLIAALCLLLCACGSSPAEQTSVPTTAAAPTTVPKSAQICDTWLTTIDCSDSCNSYILALMGQELAPYFDFTGTTVDATLTLREDGTFTFTISQEAVDSYTQQVEQVMEKNLYVYLENLLKDKLGDRTMDEYLRAGNVTIEELLVDAGIDIPLMTAALLEQLRTLPCSGTYYVADGMLHIAGTVCAYSLTETTLQISAPEDSAELAPFPGLFPLAFTR